MLYPWEYEPNYKEWTDPETGYRCMIKRHPRSLSLCGYVAVPNNHPYYNTNYSDFWVEVHGGLTFGDFWEEDGPFWFGFDCAHGYDYTPGMRDLNIPGAVYRDIEYVTKECTSLARQLLELRWQAINLAPDGGLRYIYLIPVGSTYTLPVVVD